MNLWKTTISFSPLRNVLVGRFVFPPLDFTNDWSKRVWLKKDGKYYFQDTCFKQELTFSPGIPFAILRRPSLVQRLTDFWLMIQVFDPLSLIWKSQQIYNSFKSNKNHLFKRMLYRSEVQRLPECGSSYFGYKSPCLLDSGFAGKIHRCGLHLNYYDKALYVYYLGIFEN